MEGGGGEHGLNPSLHLAEGPVTESCVEGQEVTWGEDGVWGKEPGTPARKCGRSGPEAEGTREA